MTENMYLAAIRSLEDEVDRLTEELELARDYIERLESELEEERHESD